MDSNNHTEPTGFLSLPYELRLQIYQYLLVEPAFGTSSAPSLTSTVKTMSRSPSPSSGASQRKPVPLRAMCYTAFGAPIPYHEQARLLRAASGESTSRSQSPSSSRSSSPSSRQQHPFRNGAAILRTCWQIHDEALPVLYSQNQFLAHTDGGSSLLTKWPRLREWLPPVREAEGNPWIHSLITRFRLRLRLDVEPHFTRRDLAEQFSGKTEVIVEVSQASWHGVGPDHLRLFEDVRGVKKARVTGSIGGFEEYARWLERCMMTSPGVPIEEFDGEMQLEFDDQFDHRGRAAWIHRNAAASTGTGMSSRRSSSSSLSLLAASWLTSPSSSSASSTFSASPSSSLLGSPLSSVASSLSPSRASTPPPHSSFGGKMDRYI